MVYELSYLEKGITSIKELYTNIHLRNIIQPDNSIYIWMKYWNSTKHSGHGIKGLNLIAKDYIPVKGSR